MDIGPQNLDGEPDDPLECLRSGRLYSFVPPPGKYLKGVKAAVYTIWRGEEFVYAGFAGTDGSKSGAVGRLIQHRKGDRSGDKFCVYVFDRFILPSLTQEQIQLVAAGKLKLDPLIREFVRTELEYRFVPCENQAEAKALEKRVIHGDLGRRPVLNSIAGDDGSPGDEVTEPNGPDVDDPEV